MYIRALRTQIGLLTLLIGATFINMACSTNQPQPEPVDQVQTEPVSVEDVRHPFAPKESIPVAATAIQVKADYPQQYIVKKGDTLWDINAKLLQDPWYWPEIWQRNPQVANPHLIYPGDILTLIYVDGKPQIRVSKSDGVIREETAKKADGGLKVVKLSPNIHRKSLDEAIPLIPNDAIRQFSTRPRVITKEEWEDAPYIVGSYDAHLILGADNKIYVRG